LDVVNWFRGVFAEANRGVSERLVNVPNIRETSLDDGLIEALIPESAPHLLPSGAVVRMDTHNIGGLRRSGGWPAWEYVERRRWETADIAILVFVFRGEKLIAKKIGLLQSKRLFPENRDVEEDDEVDFRLGMNRFIRREGRQAVGTLHRSFVFNENCIYGAIQSASDQMRRIDDLNERFGQTVYYLLYNPNVLPLTIDYPLRKRTKVEQVEVGCIVADAKCVHEACIGSDTVTSPTFALIKSAAAGRNWPLEVWAADLLLTCKVGQQFDDSRDSDVRYFLERRSGPIGAALAASIILPD
jgi:hypothetical protein